MIKKLILFTGLLFLIGGVISIFAEEINPATGSVVRINKDKVLTVNDKPFFPIILYHINTWEKGSETDPSTKGFNAILIAAPSPESFRAELDRAGANNLMGFAALEGLMNNRALIRKIVEECKNHPALLAWCLQDEPNAEMPFLKNEYKDSPEKLLKVYALIKSIDSNHPVYLNLINKGGDFKTYANTTDIMSTDIYPVPTDSLNAIAAGIENAKTGVENNKPVWFVAQMSPVRPSLGGKDRAPTPEEVRCMSYLAVIRGATGLSYYAYSDPNWYIPKDDPSLWGSFKGLTAELTEISPIILSPTAEAGVTIEIISGDAGRTFGYGAFHTLVKKYKDKLYLIAANSSPQPAKIRYVFSQEKTGANQIKVLFEKRMISLSGKSFTDDFNGYGVHIYEISGGESDSQRL